VSASVLYMSMSLDGYIAGPNDELGRGLGDGGERLHYWGVTPDGEFFRPPGPSVANYPLVTYVTDGIASAMAQAKAAAGDRNVMVHGAYTAQRALEAAVLDELEIHQIPVLFGGGRRLFEVLASRVELEIVRVIDTPQATHIRYRVRR
jgi:dihydrofolate reductase